MIDESQKAWTRRISQAEWDSIFSPAKSLTTQGLSLEEGDRHPLAHDPLESGAKSAISSTARRSIKKSN